MMMGHGMSMLLITSAVGYWVLTQSQKEKNNVKKIGQLLGFAIILISVLGAACKIYGAVQACKAGNCPMGISSCPFTGKSGPPMQK